MNNLKLLVVSITLVGLFSTPLIAQTQTETPKSAKKAKQVRAKCHVSLIDGSEEVFYYRIKTHKFENLADRIKGKLVSTSKSSDKIAIYKVFECVKVKDKFSLAKSRTLDENTDR